MKTISILSSRSGAHHAGMLLRLFRACVLLSMMSAFSLRAEFIDELAEIFRPYETDYVTLSPGGTHIAYTQRQGELLDLLIHDLQQEKVVRVPIAEARAAELSAASEKTPAYLTFVRWATADRLVFNLNGRNLWSIRADGSDARKLANPQDFSWDPVSRVQELNRRDQPVNVIAMPRGSAYAYVEAIMWRGRVGVPLPTPSPTNANFKSQFDGSILPPPRGRNAPEPPTRIVMRVDVNTGKKKEWAETPNAEYVLADRQGYPRIVRSQANTDNPRSRLEQYLYSPAKRENWKPLDDYLGKDVDLRFVATRTNRFAERSIPLGFDYKSDIFYFASNVGRDTYGIYAIDMTTKHRTEVAVETPTADLIDLLATDHADALVYDDWRQHLVGVRYLGAERGMLWLDDELKAVHQAVRGQLRGRTAQIVEWDEKRKKFLVLATSGSDPGVYYVYDRDSNLMEEVVNRAPWMPRSALNPTLSLFVPTPTGFVTAYLTMPQRTRLKKPPLIAFCHDGPFGRDYPEFHREAQALAAMGFAVLRVNYRGSTGFGRKHMDALRTSAGTAPVEDVMAAIDHVAKGGTIDRRFVGVMGRGFGGYVALRAMQLYPQKLRCVVTLDGIVNLTSWFNALDLEREVVESSAELIMPGSPEMMPEGVDEPAAVLPDIAVALAAPAAMAGDTTRLGGESPLDNPEQIAAAVMIIQSTEKPYARGRELASALKKLGRTVEFHSLSENEMAELPKARAALYGKIRDFLNENVYEYAVKLGETVTTDEPLAPTIERPQIPMP